MRRSICHSEPNLATAGEVNTWRFIYTSSTALPKGTRLKFDLMSKGRQIDWEAPSVNLKKTSNVIYGKLDNGKIVAAKEIDSPHSFNPDYEFILPVNIPAGGSFTIVIGSPVNRENTYVKQGTRCQTHAQRRRPLHLFIDTTGKGRYGEPEVFNIDIRGDILHHIRVLTPSFVSKNKRFDVIVRFEDEFGNLTSNAPEDTLIELSHENIRENLNWKLFVPETGFIALPNLYFNEPGIYTIRLRNSRTKEIFYSAPVKCFADSNRNLFWGLLHGESEKIDSTDNIESCLRHTRDDKAMNFFAVSPFESQEETSNEMWKHISQNIADFDENERFTTFLGCQWAGTPKVEGLRQIVFTKENKHILRKKDPKYSSLKKLYKTFSPKEIISIPCFTMGKGFEYNFDEFDSEYERVVEIYNAWGSSECTKKEGNSRPIQLEGKKGVQESAEGSIQKALQRNLRFGFVAGGLDDRGVYAELFEGDQVQYSPGLTAIIAAEQSRASMAEALHNRSCYATTGERMIVGFNLAGAPMGSEINTATKHGLLINRHLSGFVAGTSKLEKVEIVRNGKVIKVYEPNDYKLEFEYDDMQPLAKVTLDAKDKKPPFVYYYLRAIQDDGHIAWSSPIWVDHVPLVKTPKPVAKKPAKAVKQAAFDDGFDDEEDDFDNLEDEDEEV
jgi:hypothetical protein